MSAYGASMGTDPMIVGVHPQSGAFGSKLWGFYLFLVICLVAVVKAVGPAQMTTLDVVNGAAIVGFVWVAMAHRAQLWFPFVVPVLLMSVGSLLAVTNAVSPAKAFLTMTQDAYLYVWLVLLVNVMRPRGDLRTFRIVWLVSAVLMAVFALYLLYTERGGNIAYLLSSRGNRAMGLYQTPNTFAHYLVMSLFIGLSLIGQVRRALLWISMPILMLTLLATKSNGALGAFACGLVVWIVVRTIVRKRSVLLVAGIGMLLAAGTILGWGVSTGWQMDWRSLTTIEEKSLLARMNRSSESRLQIWENLQRRYSRARLGIGPGNSSLQLLPLSQRERRNSYLSKEAHNDYLAYLVERGPLALVGLLLLILQAFLMLRSSWVQGNDAVWRAGVGSAMVAALAGGMVASSVHSLVLEKLHLRHFWLFLAVLCVYRAPIAAQVGRVIRPRLAALPVPASVPHGAHGLEPRRRSGYRGNGSWRRWK